MKKLIITLFVLSISLPALCQAPPAVLSMADIDRFIETVKPMTAEFEAIPELNEDLEEEELESYEAVLQSFKEISDYEEARNIITKYGWDVDDYPQKMIAITWGTTYILMMKYTEEMPEEQAKAFRDLYGDQYSKLVNEADLDLIKSRIADLEKVFKEEDY